MMRRSWRVWLVFLGVFLAGAVAGGVVSLRVYSERLKTQAAEGRGQGDLVLKIMQRYSDRLQLSEEQRETILPHVERAAEEMQRMRARTADTMEELELRVERVLRPEQRETFAIMQEEQRARWRKIMERREEERRGAAGGGKTTPTSVPAPPPAK